MPFDPETPWRIAFYTSAGEFGGMISPATLQLASEDEAEMIAARYRAAKPGDYRPVQVDANGYRVPHA